MLKKQIEYLWSRLGYLNALSQTLIGDAVTIMLSECNASQIKQEIISRDRFFIGARTHTAIAAFSSAVPNIYISYRVKAKGINKDLLGKKPMVVGFSAHSMFDYLIDNESVIRSYLEIKLLDWRKPGEVTADEIKTRI